MPKSCLWETRAAEFGGKLVEGHLKNVKTGKCPTQAKVGV
jgi:hypothetical protein